MKMFSGLMPNNKAFPGWLQLFALAQIGGNVTTSQLYVTCSHLRMTLVSSPPE